MDGLIDYAPVFLSDYVGIVFILTYVIITLGSV